ncbi:MAG: helix-turn-helix transcriptional regulator [Firmicutes bacterium]|nr:helix-turn-helix transcriptional regulator [Bacillota bacterium]
MKFNDYLKEQLDNADFKAKYDALEPEYIVVREIIKARMENNLTQKQLAEKLGTKQSNISRLESGNYNPSLEFLHKVAESLGKSLHIEFR